MWRVGGASVGLYAGLRRALYGRLPPHIGARKYDGGYP